MHSNAKTPVTTGTKAGYPATKVTPQTLTAAINSIGYNTSFTKHKVLIASPSGTPIEQAKATWELKKYALTTP